MNVEFFYVRRNKDSFYLNINYYGLVLVIRSNYLYNSCICNLLCLRLVTQTTVKKGNIKRLSCIGILSIFLFKERF